VGRFLADTVISGHEQFFWFFCAFQKGSPDDDRSGVMPPSLLIAKVKGFPWWIAKVRARARFASSE
jgi:hypothetical protein